MTPRTPPQMAVLEDSSVSGFSGDGVFYWQVLPIPYFTGFLWEYENGCPAIGGSWPFPLTKIIRGSSSKVPRLVKIDVFGLFGAVFEHFNGEQPRSSGLFVCKCSDHFLKVQWSGRFKFEGMKCTNFPRSRRSVFPFSGVIDLQMGVNHQRFWAI